MADATTPPAEPAQADAPDQAPPDDTAGEESLPEAVRVVLKKERAAAKAAEARAKRAESRVQEFEDAQKTEAERTAEALEAAKRAAVEAQTALLRERVARRTGLPDNLVDRLRGDTEEDLMEDATSLMGALKAREEPTSPQIPAARDGGNPNPAANTAPGLPRLAAAYAANQRQATSP